MLSGCVRRHLQSYDVGFGARESLEQKRVAQVGVDLFAIIIVEHHIPCHHHKMVHLHAL